LKEQEELKIKLGSCVTQKEIKEALKREEETHKMIESWNV